MGGRYGLQGFEISHNEYLDVEREAKRLGYEVGNVFIQTHTQNVIDATKGKHHSLSKQTKEKMRVSAFKYWERKKAAINQSA